MNLKKKRMTMGMELKDQNKFGGGSHKLKALPWEIAV